jgi:imidazolonepropionase-like amidohydrolase
LQIVLALATAIGCLVLPAVCFPEQASSPPQDIVFKNATVMTASHGTIEHGSVWVHAGKIAGVGTSVNAPADAVAVDATGQ